MTSQRILVRMKRAIVSERQVVVKIEDRQSVRQRETKERMK